MNLTSSPLLDTEEEGFWKIVLNVIEEHYIEVTIAVLVPFFLRPFGDALYQVISAFSSSMCCCVVTCCDKNHADEEEDEFVFIGQSKNEKLNFFLVKHNRGNTRVGKEKRMKLIATHVVPNEIHISEGTHFRFKKRDVEEEKQPNWNERFDPNELRCAPQDHIRCGLFNSHDEIAWTFEIPKSWPGEIPHLSDDKSTIFLYADVDLDKPEVFQEVAHRWHETDTDPTLKGKVRLANVYFRDDKWDEQISGQICSDKMSKKRLKHVLKDFHCKTLYAIDVNEGEKSNRLLYVQLTPGVTPYRDSGVFIVNEQSAFYVVPSWEQGLVLSNNDAPCLCFGCHCRCNRFLCFCCPTLERRCCPVRVGVFVVFVRLLLQHLWQPIAYFLIFMAYQPTLDLSQRICGFIALFKEIVYAIVVIYKAIVYPSFLLWNIPKHWRADRKLVCGWGGSSTNPFWTLIQAPFFFTTLLNNGIEGSDPCCNPYPKIRTIFDDMECGGNINVNFIKLTQFFNCTCLTHSGMLIEFIGFGASVAALYFSLVGGQFHLALMIGYITNSIFYTFRFLFDRHQLSVLSILLYGSSFLFCCLVLPFECIATCCWSKNRPCTQHACKGIVSLCLFRCLGHCKDKYDIHDGHDEEKKEQEQRAADNLVLENDLEQPLVSGEEKKQEI